MVTAASYLSWEAIHQAWIIMSGSVKPTSHGTPALPQDVVARVLEFLDVSLRKKCQLQLVCRSFRDAFRTPQSSATWNTCSLEEDFPDNISFDELSR